MGQCISKIGPESEAQNTAATKTKNRITILILGTPGSGKSTVMKQFRILYGDGFSNSERASGLSVIANNVMESVSSCISMIDQTEIDNKGPKTSALNNLLKAATEDDSPGSKLQPKGKTKELLKLAEDIWCNENVQDLFKDQMCDYGVRVTDADGYFLKRIKKMNSPSYVPTDDDLLHMRRVTDSVEEFKFTYRNCDFTVIDVGGRKAERRKWINLFSRANMIIYSASLVDYDLALEDDPNVNSMGESLSVFESVVNLTYFQDTPLVLFLNKKDLLSKKVKAVSLADHFQDYKGPDDNPHEVVGYIKSKFLHKIKDKSRPVKVHIICATNTRDVKKAFEISLDWVLEVGK
ncbi:guanine nucleotide-binding protein G(t) subunit alpha-3-like [Rhopilema esculentum]|uniref:guanine nucleotide-binding protein G(t) subunit alpha-3-like n=1 Tax=Rhopilema esculentum TaxID=499914 RepID=UPI0031E01082|eukprot:gene14309-5348_t